MIALQIVSALSIGAGATGGFYLSLLAIRWMYIEWGIWGMVRVLGIWSFFSVAAYRWLVAG